MKYIWLSLGSNLHNPEIQIKKALIKLNKLPLTKLVECSSYYKSKALGNFYQPDFVNLIAVIKSKLNPQILLKYINKIEKEQGRKRNNLNKWCSRIIDIDIILFDNLKIKTKKLTIPHYDIKNRDFVMCPMLEIDKNITLPNGDSISYLSEKNKDQPLIYDTKKIIINYMNYL